jgi:hypothetical protein
MLGKDRLDGGWREGGTRTGWIVRKELPHIVIADASVLTLWTQSLPR